MLEVSAKGRDRIPAAHCPEGFEDRREHPHVAFFIEHPEQDAQADVVSRCRQPASQPGTHEPLGVRVEPRQDEDELLSVDSRHHREGLGTDCRLRIAEQRDHVFPHRDVRRQLGQRSKRLPALVEVGRALQDPSGQRGGGGLPRAREAAQRRDRHEGVGIEGQLEKLPERDRVVEGREAPGGQSSLERLVGAGGLTENRAKPRVRDPGDDVGRRPPVEAGLPVRQQGVGDRSGILEPCQGKQAQTQLEPGVGGIRGIVATNRQERRPLRNPGLDELRQSRSVGELAETADGFRRARSHPRIVVLESGHQVLTRGVVADQPQRKRGHQAHLGLEVSE